MNHAEQLFAEGDVNGDGTLNCEEVIALMLKVSTPLTFCLPSGHLWLPSGRFLVAFGCLLVAFWSPLVAFWLLPCCLRPVDLSCLPLAYLIVLEAAA